MKKNMASYMIGSIALIALSGSVVASPLLKIASQVVAAADKQIEALAYTEIIGAKVLAIDEENKQISILPPHMEDSVYNYIILNITDETLLSVGIKVGDCVNVKHGIAVTASLPPQTTAYEVLLQDATRTEEGVILKEAIVKSVNKETEQVIVLPSQVENHPFNYIVLNTGNRTIVSGGIEEGDLVDVRHAEVMTRSLPPQTIAYEIIEVKQMNEQMQETVTIECATIIDINKETGQITILPSGMEEDMMNYIILNTSKDHTSVRHEMNKRAYQVGDLEEGMKVKIKHSPIMTMSIPPQTPAVEIIILQNQEACEQS